VGLLIHWIALVFAFNNATVQLLVPLYALHLGYSGLIIGILAALPSIANVTLRLTFGRLSDYHGETKILRIGGLFYLAAAVGLLLSTSLGVGALVGAQLLQGVGRAVFWTVGQTYVTKLPLMRGQHLSLFNGASNLGMLLGMSGAGVFAGALGYRGAFLVVIGLALLYLTLISSLRSLTSPTDPGVGVRPAARGLSLDFNLGPLWLAAACSFVTGGTMALAASFFPVFLSRLRYGDQAIGLLVMVLAAGMLSASFVSRAVVGASAHLERLAALCIVGTGLGFAIVPALRSWPPLAVMFLGSGFCAGGCNLIYQLLVQRHSAWNARGTAMASVGLFGNVALLVLPTTIGVALKWVSLERALVAAGLFMIILGSAVALGFRSVAPPIASPVLDPHVTYRRRPLH
jgi:predicted MFS family arabinose efflux permease